MKVHFLSPAETLKLLDLARREVPPPEEITSLKRQIAEETRAAELRASINGELDMEQIEKIARWKLELDRLYAEWVQQECSRTTY